MNFIYWAEIVLKQELANIAAQGRNARTTLVLDIDLCDSAETDIMLSEIERQFAYLEAGLIEQTYGMYSLPTRLGWEKLAASYSQ